MRPAALQTWRPGTTLESLSGDLFDGALVLFRDLAPVDGLVARVRSLIEDLFRCVPAEGAEAGMPAQEFRTLAHRARKIVAGDESVERLWQEALAAIGYAPEATCRDRVRLRVVPSRRSARSRTVQALPAHRDTWGSGIMAQVNWWMPLYPLAATRTMVIWPEAYRHPVANDSASWDFEALRDKDDYPLLPVAREAPAQPGRPVLIEPGELLAFSAAHLHAGISDASGLSRFSVDTRTVWIPDLSADRRAPNVDGAARLAHWEWFSCPDLPASLDGSPVAHPQSNHGVGHE